VGSEESLRVTYLVRAAARDITARAEALMLEQTVELPRSTAARDAWVAAHILGTVERIEAAADDRYRVTIAQPLATAGGDPAQLLNVLFGNCSLQPDVVLADVDLPDAAFAWLPGPRAGIGGLREIAGVAGRPLLATALKPMGLRPDRLASLCGLFARAGIDLIKDDHGLADHAFCPFEARVEACVRALEDVGRETGRTAVYVPSVMGTPDRIARQLEFAQSAGAGAALVSPMVIGLPVLAQLASAPDGLPLFAHPSFGGVLRAEEPAVVRGRCGDLSACGRAVRLQS
jgi:ribulose-bisphosphate carboxylase large chain